MARRKPRNIYRKNGIKFPDINPNNGAVTVIQVNLTDTNELTWDLQGTLSDLGTANNLRSLPLFAAAAPPDIMSDAGNSEGPTSAAQVTLGVAPGTTRIVCQYTSPPDPNLSAWLAQSFGGDDAIFSAIPFATGVMGAIAIP